MSVLMELYKPVKGVKITKSTNCGANDYEFSDGRIHFVLDLTGMKMISYGNPSCE